MRARLACALGALLLAGCEGDDLQLTLGDQCDLTTECEAPLVCRLARCRLECRSTRDCPAGALCVTDAEGLGACLLDDETECELTSDCPDPLVCLGGSCTNECRIDRDCAPGARCATDAAGDRYCEDPAEESCLLDSECEPLVCGNDQRCRLPCATSRDCRVGTVCEDGHCVGDTPPADGGMDAGMEMDAGPDLDAGSETDSGSPEADAAVGDGGGGAVSCATPADCTAPGVAVADCVGGFCVVGSCDTGLADCDTAFETGCEVDTRTDPESCGACGSSCGVWGRCLASSCDGLAIMSLGTYHACWVRGSGLALCTGDNTHGQLGNDRASTDYVLDPTPVWMVTDAVRAEVGTGRDATSDISSSCLQRGDGRLGCFGSNDSGQLGDGTFTRRLRPVEPVGLGPVSAFSVAGRTTCAVASGTVYCWGYGQCGENGQGGELYVTTPTAVAGITGAVDVSTFEQTSCAVLGDGTVRCWGENLQGQLGDGLLSHSDSCKTSTDASFTPVTVSGISDAEQVEVGKGWVCARHADGSVSCWGRNWGGWGSAGSSLTRSETPLPIVGVSSAEQISVGWDHGCALVTGGTAHCWGRNGDGQLGAGSLVFPEDAVEVAGLTDVVEVAAGTGFACARRSTGDVHCWGTHYGELGPDFIAERRTGATPIDSLFP